MPQYMQRSGHRFVFRRAVPEALRSILGKREFKQALGSDFKEACRLARLQATLSDEQILKAKGELVKLQQSQSQRYALYQALTPISELTEELKQQLHAYWVAVVDTADQNRRAEGFDSVEDLSQFRADMHTMLDKLKADWANGNVTPYLSALNQTLHFRGYQLDVSETDERKLALQYLRSLIAGYELMIARDAGNDPALTTHAQPLPMGEALAARLTPSSTASLTPASKAAQSQRTTIMQLFEHWHSTDKSRPQKTVDSVLQHIEDFIKITKKKFADEVTKADFQSYVAHRQSLGRSAGTIAKDLSFLSAIWNAAANDDLIAQNPYMGIKAPKAKRRGIRSLESDDLKTILACPLYTEDKRPLAGGGEAAVWLPIIAMFSGARLEEIAQLTPSDIRKQGDAYYFNIINLDDDEEGAPIGGTRLKTESSRRKVPIHAEIINAGFLDYVAYIKQHNHMWLFPDLNPDRYGTRSGNWSKWWVTWRRKIGVSGRGKRFHDLRHLFKTACRDAEIGKEIHDGLTGHAPNDVGGQYGEVSFSARLKAIQKFSYPDFTITWKWKEPTKVPRVVRRKSKKAT